MNDEISETAKAVQEVAKTTRKSIEATEKLGQFVARVTNESIEAVTGILADKLRFMRWERQLRLRDRLIEIVKERKLEGTFRVIPPKLALPIIESASLEENNELQDLWANLLASAIDPNFNGAIRSAFIDIIKQLEVIDVHILNAIYSRYKEWRINNPSLSPIEYPIDSWKIIMETGMEPAVYETSIDNLIRVRCITSYIEEKEIETEEEDTLGGGYDDDGWQNMNYLAIKKQNEVTFDHQYKLICITSLGESFIEACMNQKRDS